MLPKEKVHKLREWMAERGVEACVVPSGDAHISEYEGSIGKAAAGLPGSPVPPERL